MLLRRFRSAIPSSLLFFGLSFLTSTAVVPAIAQTATSVAPVASRLTQAVDEKQLVPLKGTVHRLAVAGNDRGVAEDGLALERIQVVLKRSDAQQTALKQRIEDMHTPGTAMYHKWLTPDEFGKQFGPSDEDVATLTSWLGSHGFAVTKVNPGRQTMEISGTAGQFQQTFHAQIHKYQVNGQTHYANATDPQIPAAVAPVFGGFASLNNFQLKSHMKMLGKAQYDPSTHKAVPSWTVGNSQGISFLLGPGDFAVQYDLNPLYAAGTKGTGQTIAIINESNISIPLVNAYRSLFGLPANAPNVIIDGNDPGIDGNNNPDGPNGASGEAYLDVELAGAVAPSATIDLVIAADTALESGLALAAEHAVYGNVAPVLSLSFGYCEAFNGAANNAFWNDLWEQAAAQGQTVMVSTGDAGSAGCDDDNTQQYAVYGQQANGLGSSPWNVAVGGTDFYYSSWNGTQAAQNAQLAMYWNETPNNLTPTTTLLQRVPEQPWNDSQYGLNFFNQDANGYGTTIAGGGGGASNCATGAPAANSAGGGTCAGYPKPAWQTGTGVPADGVRDLPDLSLFASNGPNYTYYPLCASDGDCQTVTGGVVQISGAGGTSASTPSFAGIMALVNQKYGPQGQADYVLYPLSKQFPSAFHDVINGTNSMPCPVTATKAGAPFNCLAVANPATATDPTYGPATEGQIGNTTTSVVEYNAGTGYDLASGLGTIDAANLVNNWGSVKFTASTVTLTPSQTSFAHGTAVKISGTVTPNTSTGAVALETTSTEPLNAGEATFALAGGAYSGSVNYLPGGTYTIFGKYSGDGTNAPSTSTPVSVTVTPESSTTTLSALNSTGATAILSGSTVAYGTQILLDAQPAPTTIPAAGYGFPTGSVAFLDGTSTVSTETVNAEGDAEYNGAFGIGAHSLTAKYSGDASYSASTSTALAFTVAKDTPVIGLSSGSQTSSTITASPGTTSLTVQVENFANNANQQSTEAAYVNAALAPTGVVTLTGLPGGTLTFPALASGTDPNTLFIEGVATLPVPTEKAGTYTVTVSYPGDTNYAATSASASVTITAASGIATTTTASASSTMTSSSAAVTVTATVTGTTAGGFPTGTLSYISGGNSLGTITLPSTGTGDSVTETVSFNSETLYGGSNVITVQYSGSTTYQPSFATVTISNGGTQGFLLSSSGAITTTAGSNGTSTITVTPVAGLTGNVVLTCAVTPTTAVEPTCSIASPAILNGVAATTETLTLATTAKTTPGAYTVTVTGVNGAITETTSVAATVNAVTATPTLTLSNSGAITETAGGSGTSTITLTPGGGFTGSVALTCAVSPTTGTSTPTCTVTTPVSITGTTAATATLTVTSTGTTTAEAYTVTVSGTATGVTIAPTAVTATVNAVVATQTVTLSNSGAITIASPGATTGDTSTVSVTPGGGFTGSVALTCSLTSSPTGATDPPTCSVTSPVSITGTTAGTATLTVATTAAASAAMERPRMRLLPIGGGVALAGLLFFLVPVRRRRLSTLLGAIVLMVAVGFSAGCGGGSVTTPPNGGTTAGTYTVTVSGTATGVTIAPITVTVTVD